MTKTSFRGPQKRYSSVQENNQTAPEHAGVSSVDSMLGGWAVVSQVTWWRKDRLSGMFSSLHIFLQFVEEMGADHQGVFLYANQSI